MSLMIQVDPGVVMHEPAMALAEQMAFDSADFMRPQIIFSRSWLCLEHGHRQAHDVRKLDEYGLEVGSDTPRPSRQRSRDEDAKAMTTDSELLHYVTDSPV